MSQTSNGKVQNLLERAAQQNDSPTPEDSSVTTATRVFPTEAEAEKMFSQLRTKLFSIKKWNAESGVSSFELFNENGGAETEKPAAVGDFIKISLPVSGKDDWIKVVEIHESPDEIVLTVQPSRNPIDRSTKTTTSHFFTADSTNNFCLQKKGARLNFHVIGLDEKPNTKDTSGVFETIRNYAAANLASYFGIQNAHWQIFCENFLESKK